MKVIGLTGAARAGKDTVAGIVREELAHLDVKREGFADRLKVSAARALGFEGEPHELIATMDALKVCGGVNTRVEHGPYDAQESYVSGRQYLQLFGTEAHRVVFGSDFWVNAVLPLSHGVDAETLKAHPIRHDADVLVIPDVRFVNEAERVLAYGGEVWRVERPGVDAVNAHASEAGLPAELVSRTISNSGGLGYLRGAVRGALMAGRYLP